MQLGKIDKNISYSWKSLHERCWNKRVKRPIKQNYRSWLVIGLAGVRDVLPCFGYWEYLMLLSRKPLSSATAATFLWDRREYRKKFKKICQFCQQNDIGTQNDVDISDKRRSNPHMQNSALSEFFRISIAIFLKSKLEFCFDSKMISP